jgi:putative transposase
LTTKIHALVDGNGVIRRFLLSPGQKHDAPYAVPLLETVDVKNTFVLGDRGYDSDEIVQYLIDRKGIVVIPPRANRIVQRPYDADIYKLRNIIERFFNRLKQFRRIAMRFDKLASSFAAVITLAAIRILLKMF